MSRLIWIFRFAILLGRVVPFSLKERIDIASESYETYSYLSPRDALDEEIRVWGENE